jgi:hypothetical protein
MAPRQYVEKPLKVQAEQYLAATQPPIVGVCTLEHDPFPDGTPHAHVESTGARLLHDTDMLVWNHYHRERLEDVIPLAEFEDRFGTVAETTEETP